MFNKKIELLGFPMDLGADTRGVDMGPSAIRIAGLQAALEALGYEVYDRGNIKIPISSSLSSSNSKMKFLKPIQEASENLAGQVREILDNDHIPLLMGGDHSMALGSLAGVAQHCEKNSKRLGVLWIDAHTDMNTDQTTPSGNVHGMPLAASLGMGNKELTHIMGFSPKVSARNVVMMGIRSVDEQEANNIFETQLKIFTMSDIDRRSIYSIIDEVLEYLKANVDHLHLSFDMDALDPEFAPGVGTPVAGGLSYREAHILLETVASSGLLGSFELTEVNPILDVKNKTAKVAVSLIASAFGKRILY